MSQAKAVTKKFTFFIKQNWNAWQFWAVLIILFSGSAGFLATTALLKLPKTPQCARIFWPVASASLRLYCAELEAEKGNVEGLLTAINLVEALPQDHPLRHQVDENAEEWATEILNLAEEEFQLGKLQEAIAVAQKIPQKSQAYSLVEEKIAEWREIWQEAEDIFAEVEEELREANWNMAFRYAVKLLTLDNQYWATTKYDETINSIQSAREEGRKLEDAFAVLRRGGVDNWLKALEVAERVSPQSYSYRKAQELMEEAKEKLVAHIEDLLDTRDWNALANVTNRLPNSLGLTEELLAWRTFASAGLDADLGTVVGLKAAIASLEEIEADHPRYQEAQTLIDRWTLEIDDVTYLAQAREYARGGSLNDLQKAINEANLVSQGNPRYSEAREEIQDWNRQIQIIEDQPILDQARALATGGDSEDLRKAIAQANLIASNRVLYDEARGEIRKWRRKIEQREDQPILDKAIALGNIKDYRAAIDIASQIGRGRYLYSKAQTYTQRWRKEIDAQRSLERAYAVSRSNTPEALLNALDIARNIPDSTDISGQRLAALNQWGYQLLTMAKDKANLSQFYDAIALAKRIPSESAAYSSAQAQMKQWRQIIAPPPAPAPIPAPETPMQPFPPVAPEPAPAPETVRTNYVEPEPASTEENDANL